MILDVLDNRAALDRIADEWQALVCSQPCSTPFQLPVWLLTWWTHFGSGRLQVLTLREGGVLVGIVPLFLHEWNGRNQLTLLGTGLSDWTDPILPPTALTLLKQYLQDDRSWDVLHWQDLSADSPLAQLPEVLVEEDTPCTESRFNTSFDEFWAARGKDLRRNVRRYGDRARASGSVELHVTATATPELLNDLVRLHTARWQEQGEAGMIAANQAEPFLRDVAARLSSKGLLRLLILRFNGQSAAMNLGVVLHNDYFGYMSAFDPQQESHGFGRLLLYEAFRYCFQHGINSWQFLRGQETYKTWWGAQPIPKIRLYKAR